MSDPPGAGTPLDIRRLLCFVAAADTGSARAAAQRLGVGSSWLRAQIRALERGLGQDLITRADSEIALSDTGRTLHQRAVGVIDREEQFIASVAALKRADRGELELGASRLSATLPERLRLTDAFAQVHPDVQIGIWEGDSSAVLEALVRGRIDLGIALLASDSRYRGVPLRALRLRAGRLIVVGARGHRLGHLTDEIRPRDLAGEIIAAFPRSSGPELFDRTYEPLAACGARIQPYENQLQARLVRVLRHNELTVLLDWMIETLSPAQRHDLWWRPLQAEPATVDLYVVGRTTEDSAIASAAWQVVLEQLGGGQ